MSTARIRGIAKLIQQVRALDEEPFEIEAEDELPFVQLGHWVALSGVSTGALALYWMLAMHLNQSRGDRYVWPTTSILAHMLGYSRGDKIKRFVDELVAIEAVTVIAVPDVDGPQKRNVYRLRRTPPAEYAGPTSLSSYYTALSEAYEEETAGQAVYPETGAHVGPETGGHVTPQEGAVTTRNPNNTNKNGEAPSARSASGARSASASGSRAARAGGSAASSKTPPSPQQQNDGPAPAPREKTGKAAKTRQRGHTRQELAQARAVCDLFPPELGVSLVPVLTDAILVALAGDVPAAGRTVEQLGARIERRWNLHGYAAKYHAGTLTRPVGAAVAMVRPLKRGDRYGCANPRCEEGSDVDTGEPCRACTERIEDRRAERKATAKVSPPAAAPTPAEGGGVPAPRASLPPGDGRVRGNCADCGNPIFVIGPAVQDGLCRSCRHAMV